MIYEILAVVVTGVVTWYVTKTLVSSKLQSVLDAYELSSERENKLETKNKELRSTIFELENKMEYKPEVVGVVDDLDYFFINAIEKLEPNTKIGAKKKTTKSATKAKTKTVKSKKK